MKKLLWNLFANYRTGVLARVFDRMLGHRRTLLGFKNPLFMSHFVTAQAGGLYLTENDNYLALGGGRGKRVRFDPALFEPDITFLIDTLVRDGDVLLDIGANVGLHTVTLAKRVGRGRVFAFEPVIEMANQNAANCALNRLDNVTLINAALGDAPGELDMWVNVDGPGLQGTSTFIEGNFNVEGHPDGYVRRKVGVHRLDDLAGGLQFPGRIGFVKIDTEGFDTHVLEGGLATLREHRPIILVEAHTNRLKQAGKSWSWFGETFPDYHILIIHPVTWGKPYLHLEPLVGEQPQISVNLLMLPSGGMLRPGSDS